MMITFRACVIAGVLVMVAGCRHRIDVERARETLFPEVKTCARCHGEIYAEWQLSPHAFAVCNKQFQTLTNRESIARCNVCHAPTSALGGATGLFDRAWDRESGVNCLSCHRWKFGAYHGPYDARRAPHPVLKVTGLYDNSEFCGTCHRGTFEEWSAAPALAKARHCQQCHLPKVTHTITRRTPFSFYRRIHQTRSHNAGLDAVAGFPDAVRLTVLRGDTLTSAPRITVRVENRLPHSIPTGDHGFRKGVMQVTLVRDDGTTAPAAREQTFFRSLGTALPPLKEKQFAFTFAADAPTTPSAVAVTLYRVSSEGTKKIIIAEQNIPFSEIKPKSETLKTKK